MLSRSVARCSAQQSRSDDDHCVCQTNSRDHSGTTVGQMAALGVDWANAQMPVSDEYQYRPQRVLDVCANDEQVAIEVRITASYHYCSDSVNWRNCFVVINFS